MIQEVMRSYTLDHVSDTTLLAQLDALVATERDATATLLAHLAEVDARELYKPTPYPSMFAYCTRVLRLAEAVAYKRIRAARIARQFPQILDAIADGRVHVTGIAMLAPHITAVNVDELIVAATHRTKHELEVLIARLAPQPDVPDRLRRLPAPRGQAPQPGLQLDPDPVATVSGTPTGGDTEPGPDPIAPERAVPIGDAVQVDPDPVDPFATVASPPIGGGVELDPDPVPAPGHESQPAPEAVRAPASRSARVKALSPERFALQMTIGQATRDKLERARDLMRHSNPTGDLAEIIDRALDLLLADIEKKKFGKTARPRAAKARPEGADPRYASSHVRRTVHDRDGEQCTFVSADGVRCIGKAFLEYDHRTLVCRGGQPTVEGMSLTCEAHNQYEAERALGADFMREKRAAAKRERAARKSARGAGAEHTRAVAAAAPTVTERPDGRATPPASAVEQATEEAAPLASSSDTDLTFGASRDGALATSSRARGSRGSRCSEDLTRLYRSRRVAAGKRDRAGAVTAPEW